MCSRVCAKWLIGCVLTCIGLFGCQPDAVKPEFDAPQLCNAQGLRLCICAGGQATGWIPCNADRTVTECGGCSPTVNQGAPPAAGSAAVASGLGAAGSAAPAVTGAGAAGSGVQVGAASGPAIPPPAAGGGCSAGETCRVTVQGSMKFCTPDPAATFPPACTAPGQACGSNGRGTCTSGAPAGVPTALYCVVPSC